ncbi:DNA polymerase I [Chlamydia sp.]|uniref:DNA polymerase I n=1 Tax=Chlamydia sp. TaxID=35827 RepID=UPI0025BEAF20|nr:DNA polymerase I [Chlamydia sp.]MBQ8498607.1 DNA polymerase I [Chlamydia sp.]
MKKLFILDASGFVFRAYFALPEMRGPNGESTQAVFGFIRSLDKLIKDLSPQYMVAVFDGPNNKQSRQELYAEYKSNRDRQLEGLPEQLCLVKQYCELVRIPCLEREGFEADDVIASIAKKAVNDGFEVCICTADKDLLQLVDNNVSVFNPWKEQEIRYNEVVAQFGVTPGQIADYLALVGDSSDNIPGVAGCGPKKAQAFLKEFRSVEDLLANTQRLSDKNRQMIEGHRETLLLSKRLANLHADLNLPLKTEELAFSSQATDVIQLNMFCMQHGFKALIKPTEIALNPISVQIVKDFEDVRAILETLKGKEVGYCAAYTGEHLPSLQLHGVALSSRDQVVYIEVSGDQEIPLLKAFFADPTTRFFGYRVKRDNHALKNYGIDVHVTADLVLAEHLVSGGAKISFQTVLIESGRVQEAMFFAKEWATSSLPVQSLPKNPAQYFGMFASQLLTVKNYLFEKLEEKALKDIFETIEQPLESVLFSMECAGMPLDSRGLSTLDRDLSKELEAYTQEIYNLAGCEFNIKSPKQLADILYNRLGIEPVDNVKSTKAEVLEALENKHEIITKILAFRATEKMLSTYVRALPKQIDSRTQRIHSTFNQVGTVTGRLACQDPNLQNIPIRSERGRSLREAFRVEKDNDYFVSADYSQIELRFLTHLSQDETLKQAFDSGEDIHTFTASQVFNVPLEQVTKKQRHQAKAVNFGLVYGQQAYGLSKILKISVSEAQGLIDAYFARYPRAAEFITQTIAQASKDQKVTTMLGRERILSDWESSPGSRATLGRLAVNTRIQGSAAELIKLAMLDISKEIASRRLKSRLLLQIHDELLFEVPEEELEEAKILIQEKMESAMKLSVPLVVNVLIGKNWAEC